MHKAVAALTAVSLLAAIPVRAQAPSAAGAAGAAKTAAEIAGQIGQQATPGKLTDYDQAFLKETAQSLLYESAIATLAGTRGSTPAVRALATSLSGDLKMLLSGLTHLFSVKNLTIPTEMSPEDLGRQQRMQALSGTAFDAAFVAEVQQISAKGVPADKIEIGATQSGDVKAFTQQLQHMQENHSKMAQLP